jgi:Holliday junction resolvase-like predicted endonuclease
MEIDILAVNGEVVVTIEVKFHPDHKNFRILLFMNLTQGQKELRLPLVMVWPCASYPSVV